MWTNIKCTFIHFIFLEKLIDSLEQNNNIKLVCRRKYDINGQKCERT